MPRDSGRPPANDNQDPDEAWQRADLILYAYSGLDLNNADNQKLAITQLLTDVMHYCEVMNIMKPSEHPEFIDFDKLLHAATEHYEHQSYMINDVIDNSVEGFRSRLDKKLAEREKNPTPGESPMPQDNEFTAKVDFIQDPEFLALEKKLIERQEKDRKALEERQTEQRIEFGKQPGVTREQLDDNHDKQIKEREAQSKTFKAEHDRHIREFHKAKAILAEMKAESRERTLEQQPDQDPKHSF